MSPTPDAIYDEVRAHYGAAATAAAAGQAACCGADAATFGSARYDDLEGLPDAAALASIGCGNPVAVADLQPGETVLDLGSGGGIDVLLSARRVGPTGFVYGIDMTTEMLDLARHNATEAGAQNVEFRPGTTEEIPLPDGSVDVVISNCVINLSPDKDRVFAEMHRVLRPGGRIGVSDVVTAEDLSDQERAERGSRVGCVAGALSIRQYRAGLEAVGFSGISITFTHDVADGVHSAVIKGTKPSGA
jgi:arsenite methyltransferase